MLKNLPTESQDALPNEGEKIQNVRKSRWKFILALIGAVGLPAVVGGSMTIYARNMECKDCDVDTIIKDLNRPDRSSTPAKEKNMIQPDGAPKEKPRKPENKEQKRIKDKSEEDSERITMMA